MSNFRHVSAYDLEGNYFRKFDREWALVTAMKPDGDINTMTVSWGGTGIMWSKPVFVCVIRPQRYTFEFAENADKITLSFFGKEYRQALNLCGTKSGRDMNKIAAAGLTVIRENGAVYFKEASTVLIGRKVYSDWLREDSFIDKSLIPEVYPSGDFHKFYVCIIEDTLVK